LVAHSVLARQNNHQGQFEIPATKNAKQNKTIPSIPKLHLNNPIFYFGERKFATIRVKLGASQASASLSLAVWSVSRVFKASASAWLKC